MLCGIESADRTHWRGWQRRGVWARCTETSWRAYCSRPTQQTGHSYGSTTCVVWIMPLTGRIVDVGRKCVGKTEKGSLLPKPKHVAWEEANVTKAHTRTAFCLLPSNRVLPSNDVRSTP
jgi:hypothetical protein